MKHPKMRTKTTKKIKQTIIRRIKKEISEIVHDCLIDIQPYIVRDILMLLQKRGVINAKKQKKN